MSRISIIILFITSSLWATNYTVKAGGGGSFTTLEACAAQMSTNGTGVSDTCTVFAGTYTPSGNILTIPAGSAGNYKIFNVNGTDAVTVTGSVIISSHTKFIGNCTAPANAGSCGFTVSTPAAPKSGACVGWNSSITDFYIVNNVMTECGAGGGYMIGSSFTVLSDHGFIQGNTLSYACVNSGNINQSECNSIMPFGDHFLVEGNDLSHYTLSIDYGTNLSIYRNNTFHDQFETEASGNHHTDILFAEPGAGAPYTVEENVFEGNLQRNAVGADAKSILSQNDTGNACASHCFNLIVRYNVTSRIGGAINSNNGGSDWPFIKVYNNTNVDSASDINLSANGGGVNDNSQTASHATFLNNIYYLTSAQTGGGSSINMYACGTNCTAGYSDYFCTAGCATVNGHTYGVCCWSSDTGNQNADPLFANYISAGNASNDYHLKANSPALNAGSALTTVNGTIVNSTALVVADASYFQDSYGLSNAFSTVSPDCVSVTTVANHVCVTAVNYSTNTLTLASPISATNGDSVWLYSDSSGTVRLTGSAPNIGAFGSATPAPTAPIFLLRAN